MGTVNVLEAIRLAGGVRVAVVVTSDKCYDNREQGRPFTEDDPMGGHDPYSNSKGAAELVTSAYRDSFFAVADEPVALASARAGNVIGGGDWGEDRLIPDIMNAALAKAPIPIRNPSAVRPWQHVLNPLAGYLALAGALWADPALAGGWNFGPAAEDVRPVGWIADRLTELWPDELRWELDPGPHPREAGYLALDSTKAHERLGWSPVVGPRPGAHEHRRLVPGAARRGGHARRHGRPGGDVPRAGGGGRVKAVILAGGLGSRLSEETTLRPKPMVEIGGKPILWHIMKIYAAHGIDEFVVCLGYKGYVIKEWFANYALHTSDVTFDLRSGEMRGAPLDDRAVAGHAGRDRRGRR